MAAGVQHHDRAGRQVFQVFQQAATVNAVAEGVVVAVVAHRETGGFEQGAVVFPARVTDGDGSVWQQTLEEVCTDFQRAGTAQGLGGNGAALLDGRRVLAEQ